jgi:hypothetical protein
MLNRISLGLVQRGKSMKINAIQFMGGHFICMMDSGEGIDKDLIEGDVRVGVLVEYVSTGKYIVTGAAPEECKV